MSALSLASAHLSKLRILFANHLSDLSDGDLCKNFFYFHIYSFLLFFKSRFDLIDVIRIALQTQQSGQLSTVDRAEIRDGEAILL